MDNPLCLLVADMIQFNDSIYWTLFNNKICDLLWRNSEQVASDIWLISDLVQTNSVGYNYGQ